MSNKKAYATFYLSSMNLATVSEIRRLIDDKRQFFYHVCSYSKFESVLFALDQ